MKVLFLRDGFDEHDVLKFIQAWGLHAAGGVSLLLLFYCILSASDRYRRCRDVILCALAVVLISYALLFGPELGSKPDDIACDVGDTEGDEEEGQVSQLEVLLFLAQWLWLVCQVITVLFRTMVRWYSKKPLFRPSSEQLAKTKASMQARMQGEILDHVSGRPSQQIEGDGIGEEEAYRGLIHEMRDLGLFEVPISMEERPWDRLGRDRIRHGVVEGGRQRVMVVPLTP